MTRNTKIIFVCLLSALMLISCTENNQMDESILTPTVDEFLDDREDIENANNEANEAQVTTWVEDNYPTLPAFSSTSDLHILSISNDITRFSPIEYDWYNPVLILERADQYLYIAIENEILPFNYNVVTIDLNDTGQKYSLDRTIFEIAYGPKPISSEVSVGIYNGKNAFLLDLEGNQLYEYQLNFDYGVDFSSLSTTNPNLVERMLLLGYERYAINVTYDSNSQQYFMLFVQSSVDPTMIENGEILYDYRDYYSNVLGIAIFDQYGTLEDQYMLDGLFVPWRFPRYASLGYQSWLQVVDDGEHLLFSTCFIENDELIKRGVRLDIEKQTFEVYDSNEFCDLVLDYGYIPFTFLDDNYIRSVNVPSFIKTGDGAVCPYTVEYTIEDTRIYNMAGNLVTSLDGVYSLVCYFENEDGEHFLIFES